MADADDRTIRAPFSALLLAPGGSVSKSLDDECPMAGALAVRLRKSKRELTNMWLERIAARVALDPTRVFPTDEVLDHVPLLLDGIDDYIDNPAAEISVDMVVVAKARELGALRHKQGFDAYEILKEYEILGGILFHFFAQAAEEIEEPCGRRRADDLCEPTPSGAVTIIQQATMTHFLLLADQRIAEREGRLRAFNRVISHEVKNRIGAMIGANAILEEGDIVVDADRSTMIAMIGRNARDMRTTVENVLAMSHLEHDVRQHRNVRLPETAKESARQVRETAQAAGVEIRIVRRHGRRRGERERSR